MATFDEVLERLKRREFLSSGRGDTIEDLRNDVVDALKALTAIPRVDATQPSQPIEIDENGTHRFKKNAIVRFILDNRGTDLNQLAYNDFNQEDWDQFYQLIGYSVSGYCELSLISNGAKDRAESESLRLCKPTKPPGKRR